MDGKIHPKGAAYLAMELLCKAASPFNAEERRNLDTTYQARKEFIMSKGFVIIADTTQYGAEMLRIKFLERLEYLYKLASLPVWMQYNRNVEKLANNYQMFSWQK